MVPEFHGGDSAREIKLGITRLNSGQATANSPLFRLTGGPGQAESTFDLDASGVTCSGEEAAVQLLDLLSSADTWRFDTGGLVITLAGDDGSLIFK